MTEVTEAAIDAGAQFLRETQQAGKRLTDWADVPKATKKKWLLLSAGVLRAAATRIPAASDDVDHSKLIGDLRTVFGSESEGWSTIRTATLERAIAALLIPATGEAERDTAVRAWSAGARAVHDEWAKADEGERFYLSRDHEPDFTEAAYDYAAALTDHTTKDDE